jgi:hypothetical protein
MIYYVSYLKDRVANNYLGLDIPHDIVEPYLNELESIIGEDDFKIFTDFQKQRDSGKYHLTVINVMDYNRLSNDLGIDKFINSLEPIFQFEIDDLKMMGLFFIYNQKLLLPFKFKIINKYLEEIITPSYNSLENLYTLDTQFKCLKEDLNNFDCL